MRKGDTVNNSRHRKGFGLPGLGLALAAGLALVVASACKTEKPAPTPAPAEEELSLQALTPVFGEAQDTNSGLADFTLSDEGLILSYHFYLTDPSNADQEISRDLAPKIRRLYGHFKNVDRVSFEVSLPDQESPVGWDPYVSFSLTRKLVKETGWSDLLDTDLLSGALDVKRAK
jgi:hypothetical protein